MAMLSATNTVYPTQSTAPKEIGLMTRVDGVRSGLQEISHRLDAFAARLEGTPTSEPSPQPAPCGLPSNLSEMEAHIRGIMSTLERLQESF